MKVIDTEIPDVKLIEPAVFGDDRGYFFESWQAPKFRELGIDVEFLQDNESYSSRGTLRGIHLQVAHPQGKLVRVSRGEVFDVAVDLRPDSATVGQWVGRHLTDTNHHMLWIPPGFGHAFLVLSETATFNYKCTDVYYPNDQFTLAWDCVETGVQWPTLEGAAEYLLSQKDREGLGLTDMLEVIHKASA